MDTTIVIFRWEREGGVFALFPELPSRQLRLLLYLLISTSANIVPLITHLCIANSRPATPSEYRDLFNELEGRGYNLIIRHRATPVMHERRRFQAIS